MHNAVYCETKLKRGNKQVLDYMKNEKEAARQQNTEYRITQSNQMKPKLSE